MRLPFGIALRFLWSNKSQTILISLGIAVGVSVQIFIGLLIQGLQADLIDTTIGRTSQITVLDPDKKDITGYEDLLETVNAYDGRLNNITAVLDRAAFADNGEKSISVLIRGLDLETADGVYKIKESIIKGVFPNNNDSVMIGKGLAEELDLDLGDEMGLLNIEGESSRITVSGVFDFGVSNIDLGWILTTRETVRDINKMGDVVSSIEMQVSDVFAAKEVADKLSLTLGDKYLVTNWQDDNEELLSGLNGQSISSLIIQIFVLVTVVLGIASVLAISVIQKSKQIGILKAMGIKDKDASRIFLFQGIMLGIVGAVIGVLLGSCLLFMFTAFAKNPDGTPVINIVIKPGFILFSGAVAVISAMIASLIPARKSSKLSPIEVIRNG